MHSEENKALAINLKKDVSHVFSKFMALQEDLIKLASDVDSFQISITPKEMSCIQSRISNLKLKTKHLGLVLDQPIDVDYEPYEDTVLNFFDDGDMKSAIISLMEGAKLNLIQAFKNDANIEANLTDHVVEILVLITNLTTALASLDARVVILKTNLNSGVFVDVYMYPATSLPWTTANPSVDTTFTIPSLAAGEYKYRFSLASIASGLPACNATHSVTGLTGTATVNAGTLSMFKKFSAFGVMTAATAQNLLNSHVQSNVTIDVAGTIRFIMQLIKDNTAPTGSTEIYDFWFAKRIVIT